MSPIIQIESLSKIYDTGFEALKSVSLDVEDGEILALLGPNGAGKTTLISIIVGLVNATGGSVTVDGRDIVDDYRHTRALIGLVPQEITTDAFETVWATITHTRGLFGLAADPAYIEQLLKDLSLWDKKGEKLMTLSGGMKRRVMIAKALSHKPRILFLDEPTAGVDVELRKDMWALVRRLKDSGVTIILTTHYIDEAEEIADRVAVINHGEIIVVEEKAELMRKLGQKTLFLDLQERLTVLPESLSAFNVALSEDGNQLIYTYDTNAERTGITRLLATLNDSGIRFRDLSTTQSSLEDIFVKLVRDEA